MNALRYPGAPTAAEPHRAIGRLLDGIYDLARQSIALTQQRPCGAVEARHAVVRADPKQSVAVTEQTPDPAAQQAALLHGHRRAVVVLGAKQSLRRAEPSDTVGGQGDSSDHAVEAVSGSPRGQQMFLPAEGALPGA